MKTGTDCCGGEAGCMRNGFVAHPVRLECWPCACEFGMRLQREVYARHGGVPDAITRRAAPTWSAGQRSVAQMVAAWAEGFVPGETAGIYLWGDVGRGKTTLGEEGLRRLGSSRLRVVYKSWPAFMLELRSAWRAGYADRTEAEMITDVIDCDVLMLDDIGGESRTPDDGDHSRAVLLTVLDTAIQRQRPALLMTSNLGGGGLESRYDARTRSRVSEACSTKRGGFVSPVGKGDPDFRSSGPKPIAASPKAPAQSDDELPF